MNKKLKVLATSALAVGTAALIAASWAGEGMSREGAEFKGEKRYFKAVDAFCENFLEDMNVVLEARPGFEDTDSTALWDLCGVNITQQF